MVIPTKGYYRLKGLRSVWFGSSSTGVPGCGIKKKPLSVSFRLSHVMRHMSFGTRNPTFWGERDELLVKKMVEQCRTCFLFPFNLESMLVYFRC